MDHLKLKFNTEDNNMPIRGSLPTSGSKNYNSLCEVTNELAGSSNAVYKKLSEKLRKRDEIYQKYLQEDHSDIGPHFHAFDDIPLINGYKACTGVSWPQKVGDEADINIALIKECDVKNISYVMVIVRPSLDDEAEPVFVTENFLQNYGDCTKSARSLFFLEAVLYDSLLSENGMGEVRWLLSKGVAFGYRYCHFCVFNEFNDVLKYPAGNVSPDDRDNLLDSLWNDI